VRRRVISLGSILLAVLALAVVLYNATLVDRATRGKRVVRLKGGDPFVFGRGAEEVLACLRAGVPVTVVPGVTSAVAVPASAWVPVTHRGVAQEFHVVSVHVAPGDERSTVNWELLGGSQGTLVLLMAVERLGAVAGELLRYGRSPDTPVSVIADGTLPTQRTINSTLEQVESCVAEEGIRPPAIVVVGDVVSVAAEITERLSVPTIGIGAGPHCDGQVLVYHDLLGLTEGHLPRFVKRYANLSREIRDALESYAEEVRSGTFPEEQHTYEMPAEELEAFERSMRSPSRSKASDHATKTSSTAAKAQAPAPRSEPPLRKTSSP